MDHEIETTDRSEGNAREFLARVSERLASRREFMGTATKVGAGAIALSAGSGLAAANDGGDSSVEGGGGTQNTVDVLNFALLLERLEATFYTEAVGTAPPGESGGGGVFTETDIERSDPAKQFAAENLRYSTYGYLQQIRDHEQAHVDALVTAIEGLGGDPVGNPGFVFSYNTVAEFVDLARLLEDTGAAAYAGAVPALADSEYLLPAARILAVEARHASYFRVLTLSAQTPHPDPLQRTLGMEQVRDRVAPFIAGNDADEVQTLVSIPGPRAPENIGFAENGDLYFGSITGELRRLAAEHTDATGLPFTATDHVATFGGTVLGVEVVEGTPYVALVTGDERTGVYAVPDSEPEQVASIQGTPNGVLYDDDNDRLLVTESSADSLVYAVSLADETAAVWVDSPLFDTAETGADGITFGPDGDVFVTVLETNDGTGRIVRVPVGDDGSAGEPATYVEGPELLGVDDLIARDSDLYVAVNQQNKIVRVTPDQEVTSLISGDPLVFPSDVLFGPTQDQRDALFICNFAAPQPGRAAILRTHL